MNLIAQYLNISKPYKWGKEIVTVEENIRETERHYMLNKITIVYSYYFYHYFENSQLGKKENKNI